MKTKEAPGIVFITDSTGIDATEVTNYSWLEFLYWTGRIYGKQSPEYNAILPDTSLWLQMDTVYHSLVSDYLRHPFYRDYPVVGVSYEQMQAFCSWRSDRVFEYGLIQNGYADWCVNPDPDSVVTIEKYKKGFLFPKKPAINRFPHYHLPSREEWQGATLYAIERYRLAKFDQKGINIPCYQTYRNSGPFPVPVAPGKKLLVKRGIYFLGNNMSEQLNEKGVAAGQNWKGSTGMEHGSDFRKQTTPSLIVGFRCAFDWER